MRKRCFGFFLFQETLFFRLPPAFSDQLCNLVAHPVGHDVQEISKAQAEEAWQTVQWREGSQGPLHKQFLALRVHAGTGCAHHSESHGRSWTGPEGWLLAERSMPREEGEPKWFFSNLPADTSLSRLVELVHLRWPIEQFYEDAKGECGLDHFQGRSWQGLHRHLALVMLVYTFLMLQSLAQEIQADPVPAGAAFPPCSTTQPSGLPSADARPALPGCGLMAYRNRTSQSFSSSSKLTE